MNLKKYSWLAALPMIFTACQDDMLVETAQQQGIYTLKATVEDGSASSRAQIVLNGTSTEKESFHWNEGDGFSLFELDGDDSWLKHQFDISESYNEQEPTTSADFSTSSSLTQGREFVAFYPACKEDESGNVQMTIDMTLLDNKKESWTEYFQNNMFMKAKGTVGNTSADTEVNFTQLCGIIRITYKNTSNEDRTLGAIKVDGLWSIGGYCPLNDVNTFVPNVTQENAYGINFENGATVKASSSEDFYILFLYNSVEGNSQPMSTVSVSDMDHNVILKTPIYSEKLPVFEAGKCYWLNVTDDGEELCWTNDQQGGEDSGDSGTTDEAFLDVSTFAELQKALATETTNLYINFLDNIALEGPLSVTCPTTLELNGYTLSLSDDYMPGDADAVIDVNGRLNIYNGEINGKDGSQLHDYYFKMSGTQLGLNLYGVTLETGTAVANAIFMDDDRLSLSNKAITSEAGVTFVESTIQGNVNAIYYLANNANPRYMSMINGTIIGDVYIETEYETLNAEMQFTYGTITGNLVCKLPEDMDISEYVSYSYEGVTIEDAYKDSWSKAGRYVEDQNYSVSTFDDLKTAIETAQESDEATHITLMNDIELSSPLTITKPVNIYGDYTIEYKGDEGAALTVTGSSQKEVSLVLTNTSLIVEETATAICVEDAHFRLGGSTNITVDDGGNAIHFCANTKYLQPNIVTTGTITGNVTFTANYKDDKYPNIVVFRSGTINGDLITSGTYASDVKVAFEGGTAIGEGWADADINSGDSDSNVDSDAVFVSTQADLENALEKDVSIALSADIKLTTPLFVRCKNPLYLNGYSITVSADMEWSDAEAAITVTKGGVLNIMGKGYLYGINTDSLVEKAFMKAEGELHLDEGIVIKPYMFQDVILVEDGICIVNNTSIAEPQRYALNIVANTGCDVDIYQSTVYGGIRFALNSEAYGTSGTNYCRFGVGPSSQVVGDLIIDGTYKDTATGYYLQVESTAKTEGDGWDDNRIQSVTASE